MIKHEEILQKQLNEPKTTIGGMIATKNDDSGVKLSHMIKKSVYEKIEQSYGPIKLPYTKEEAIAQPSQMIKLQKLPEDNSDI
jgi:hypothetical protein